MTDPTPWIPDGLTAVTPYLILRDVLGFVEFARRAFGAELVLRSEENNGDQPRHVRISFGGAAIEIGGARPEWPEALASLHVYVPDAEAAFAAAIEAGATELYPVTAHDYGERSGGVKDPFGVSWFIATADPA